MIKKNDSYTTIKSKNPMESQNKTYIDLLQSERNDKKRWQKICAVFVVIVFLCFAVVFYATSLQRNVPVLITVTDWGEAQFQGKITQENFTVPEIAIKYQVRSFIENTRIIPADPDVMAKDIEKCFNMITDHSYEKLKNDLQRDAPFLLVGKVKREITIESILNLTQKHTYQVDWLETRTENNSAYNTRYRGIFTVALKMPTAETETKNPLGIYIDDYSITMLQQGVKK
jgi:type IV secretion system protein VirB5